MKKLILLFLFLSITLNIPLSFALDTSVNAGKQQKTDKTKDLQQRKGLEKSKGFEITLTTDGVFIPLLAEMEKRIKPFSICKLITAPKQAADFGLHAFDDVHMVDIIKAQYLEQQAKANGIAPHGIQRYKNCMAIYGAVIAQAHLNLMDMMPDSVDLEDMQDLAKIAIEKAVYDGKLNSNIKATYNAILSDRIPCRFNNSLTSFGCGSATLDLVSQKLIFGGLTVYGDRFMGLNGKYTASTSTKKTKEMILAQKKSWEESKSTKHSISTFNLLPK